MSLTMEQAERDWLTEPDPAPHPLDDHPEGFCCYCSRPLKTSVDEDCAAGPQAITSCPCPEYNPDDITEAEHRDRYARNVLESMGEP